MMNLHTYLQECGISQRDFARLIGVDPGIVSRLSRGLMRPSLELAAKIETATRGKIKAVSWVSAPAYGAPATDSGQVMKSGKASA